MRAKDKWTRIGIVFGYGLIVFGLLLVAIGVAQAAEVCPEAGKVESMVDGDLDDIVLDAGTQVCIKGGQTLVNVTADGEATLAELLGTGQNVSHYAILEEPSNTTTTTTSIPATTTTTSVPPTTTTSTPATSTTVPTSSTTTTQPPSSSTTTVTSPTTTETSQPTTSTSQPTESSSTSRPEISELPYTGMGSGALALLASGMLGLGLVLKRKDN